MNETPISGLHVIDHPLVAHKLTQMRRVETPSGQFRSLLTEISLLLAYEVTRDLELRDVRITTPMTESDQPELVEDPVVVSILRAGNGLLANSCVAALTATVPATFDLPRFIHHVTQGTGHGAKCSGKRMFRHKSFVLFF